MVSSCISHKKFNYAPISSIRELEGVYFNDGTYPSKIIKVDYINDKKLQVSHFKESAWDIPVEYKGKFDHKKSTFERWVHRGIYPFIIVIGYNFEKEQIGKDDEGNLIINRAYDHMGMLIPIGAGGDKGSSITQYNPLKEQILIPVKSNDKWGYKDILTDELMISYCYDSVCLFQDTLARVRIGNKWGVINQKDDIITPFEYDRIEPLNGKSMRVEKNQKWGLLSNKGNLIVPCEYTMISYFRENHLKVFKEDKCGIIKEDGSIVLPCEYDKIKKQWNMQNMFVIEKSLFEGLADIDGVICPPIFKNVEIIENNKKHPDIVAIAHLFDNQLFYLDSKGYLYSKRKEFLRNFIDYEIDPDYKTKIHYSDFLLNLRDSIKNSERK